MRAVRMTATMKLSAIGISVACLTGLSVAPASAVVPGGGGCYPDFFDSSAYASYVNVGSGWYSLQLSNGTLLARFINNYTGIDVEYQKSGGSEITADFRYYNNTTLKVVEDSGSFTETAGQTRSYAWNNQGSLDCVDVAMYVSSEGASYEVDLYTGN
jgi:hypothetical protein